MSAATFYIKLGDQLPVLEGDLLEADGSAVDLTGATVKLGVRRKDTRGALLNTAAAVSGDPTLGRARYAWAAGDTSTLGVGEFEGEFQVSWPDGRKGSFPSDGYIPIVVLRDIAS